MLSRETREDACDCVRKALDLLDESIDKSMDLQNVMYMLSDTYHRLCNIEAKGEQSLPLLFDYHHNPRD